MIALAHFAAISLYIGSVAVAAAPFARPVRAPVRAVALLLASGILLHLTGLVLFARAAGGVPFTGLGPALSFAGLLLATMLVVAEVLARDVSLTVVAAPLAALPTIAGVLVGLTPPVGMDTGPGARGAWLLAHIALSLTGIAAFGTAAAAGTIYLIQGHQLKARHFGANLRFFPPLATLDRVNHIAAVAGWLTLTVGIVLAGTYAVTYGEGQLLHLLWAMLAWVAVSGIALGRVTRGWQARRAAVYSSVAFSAVLLVYVALRIVSGAGVGPSGRFL